MNNDDNKFEALQRLLTLKRHETPPPGYFNDFSGSVISRLRAGEANQAHELSGRFFSDAPWLARFLQIFEAKPAYAGGLAAAACLLLLGGVIITEHDETTPDSNALFSVAAPTGQAQATPVAATQIASQTPSLPLTADASGSSGGLAVTTNYSLQPVATMFGQQNFFAQPQPVSFSPSGN